MIKIPVPARILPCLAGSLRLVAAALLVAGLAAGPAAGDRAQTAYPTSAGEARRLYESWIDNWTDGPAELLLTNEEREIWDGLEDTPQRTDFIQWFWDRRDPDGRQVGNEFKETFYENVAESNLKFRGIPKGWKSDRGRVRIMFGKADYVGRRSQAELFGRAGSAEFEIWRYYNIGSKLAFQAVGGEFNVYFISTTIGRYEIYDFQWGAGIWDRNIRLAFEYTRDASIIDPVLEFETGESAASYVREITEGTLPVEIPLDLWTDVGGGGTVSVPVRIRLGDLLFQPDGDQFVAALEARLTVLSSAGAGATQVSESWEIRLGEEELLAIGSGSFVAPITVAVEPGEYRAELTVSHPLASTDAEWNQPVQVTAEPAVAIVVGTAALSLDQADESALAVVMSKDAIFASGGPLVVAAWMSGVEPNAEALSLQLETPDGSTVVLDLEEVRWLGGLDGPLLARTRIPDIESGDYILRVDFGAGLEAVSTPVKVAR